MGAGINKLEFDLSPIVAIVTIGRPRYHWNYRIALKYIHEPYIVYVSAGSLDTRHQFTEDFIMFIKFGFNFTDANFPFKGLVYTFLFFLYHE